MTPDYFSLLTDVRKIRRYADTRRIRVDDFLEYVDSMISLGLLPSTKGIDLKLRVQTASDLAREHNKVHSFYITSMGGRVIGAIRCFPDGEVKIGRKAVQ